MKTILKCLAVAALALLSSCTTNGGERDPMRVGMSYGMQGAMAAHQQASLQMAGAPRRQLQPMQMTPLAPLPPLAR